VQHHKAHVAARAVENDVEGPYLGVSWDGTGYGLDRAIWGGEFFRVDGRDFQRVAHLRSFQLPRGEAAVREGWRSAASLMFEIFGAEATDPKVRPYSSAALTLFPQPAWGGCLMLWPVSQA